MAEAREAMDVQNYMLATIFLIIIIYESLLLQKGIMSIRYVHTFFHVKIMVSNAIPLLFGNYDAHIMYIIYIFKKY